MPTARAAIDMAQNLSITVTTNDTAGVTWSAAPAANTNTQPNNVGTFSAPTSLSGAPVTYTPKGPGTFTITATSKTDTTKTASLTLYVTDLQGVYTYHQDISRDGANVQEYALTPQNVNTSTFGKLFSCQADGAIYAQPLWVAGVTIAGATSNPHNVVYVATEHDGLFAFDADASPCQTLWHANLIDTNHGATAGETPVPDSPSNYLVGGGGGDQDPEVGVTGTPVIDPSTGTLFVVSKSVACSPTPCSKTSTNTFYQRLHAIDITSGAEKGTPLVITPQNTQYPGAGDGGTEPNAVDVFNDQTENQRTGLTLVPGAPGTPSTVYVAWSSHEDYGRFYGWIIGYTWDGKSLTQSYVLNVAPNSHCPIYPAIPCPNGGHGAGIWMSGGAPAADPNGNVYLITGNGPFDANAASAPNNDYGDSLIKLTAANGKLSVSDYFTPADQASDDQNDDDFGAGGATILAQLSTAVTINGTPVQNLILGGEEDGNLFVLNRDKLGGYDTNGNNAGVVQWIQPTSHETTSPNNGVIYGTGAYWNGNFYIMVSGSNTALQVYQLNPTTAQFTPTPAAASSPSFGYPGGTPTVSAQGATNGVLWILDLTKYCTPATPGTPNQCSAAVLHAYDAANFKNGQLVELWNSAQVAGDVAGFPVKFTVPMVANGKVYVGTRGNNQGDTCGNPCVPGELDVYGLKSH